MRVSVGFQNDRLELDVPDGRLVAEWHGPAGVATGDVPGMVRAALERPSDYPPLRQAAVPGDRVVIALDAEIPEPRAVLDALISALGEAGVDPGSIAVLLDRDNPAASLSLPEGVERVIHDPDDRARLAYLASTSEGRRVYLNRLLTDADVVVPVGLLGYDPVFGYRGPWSLLFPGLSDRETARAFRAMAGDEPPDRERPRPSLVEASEVSWLLGSQFHLGLMPGASGLAEAVAGLESAVRDRGAMAIDRAWSLRADERAETVVVGIGRPGLSSGIDDLADGLATATRLVRRGGKIVALSRAVGSIGPALGRLIEAGDPRLGPAPLRGHEADPDYPAARRLALALAWADVYLLSDLAPDAIDDLGIIALDRPEEARRLVAASGSCLLVSQAERVRAEVADEP